MIPVHLFGATVELDRSSQLTREAGVHVIEDACQAHGARYRGRRVGSLGVFGCFSFYPTKNLGAWGDGGAVVTSVPELADRVQLLRAHGERPRYHHRWSARPRGWTRCRPRCCGASSLGWTAGTKNAAGSARRCAHACSDSPSSQTRGPQRDRAHRALPSRRATTSSTCSWCAARSATRCASTWQRAGSPRRSTIRADPPDRGLRGPRSGAGQPAGVRAPGGAHLLAAAVPGHERRRARACRCGRFQLRARPSRRDALIVHMARRPPRGSALLDSCARVACRQAAGTECQVIAKGGI